MTSVKTMLAAAVLAFGSPMTASAADMAGTWVVKAEFGPKLKYTLLCLFKPDGPGFAGPCAATDDRVLKVGGAMGGGKMRLSYATNYMGSDLVLEFTGATQANGFVKGLVEDSLAKGAFQAAPLSQTVGEVVQAWSIDVAFSTQMKYSLFCAFNTKGGRLRGPCVANDGAILPTKGAADGANVTMAYDTRIQGNAVHVDYAGALQPDGSLKGTIKSEGGVGVFTASRQ